MDTTPPDWKLRHIETKRLRMLALLPVGYTRSSISEMQHEATESEPAELAEDDASKSEALPAPEKK